MSKLENTYNSFEELQDQIEEQGGGGGGDVDKEYVDNKVNEEKARAQEVENQLSNRITVERERATAKENELDLNKQDKLTTGSDLTTVSDSTKVSYVDLTNKNVISFTLANLWNWVKTKIKTTISSATTNEDIIGGKVIYDELQKKQDKLENDTELSEVSDSTKTSFTDLTNKKIKSFTLAILWNWVKGKITELYYPVGIVIFNTGTNPQTNLGGTWSLYATGTKALYLDATAETTINEELPNLKLEVNNLFLKGDRREPTTSPGTTITVKNNEWSGTNSSPATNLQELKFNANGYNSVYKDNGKVRAEGITICAWKRTA